ncbi:phage tail spike protein [Oceanobacillus sojae]|uniref:phage tail spike protein n=1 Tax=Oceanobacillus sojae TaxID=582851 RepID=UPI0009887480|nr:phage tail spike protein [Oceanobacillus sojae]
MELYIFSQDEQPLTVLSEETGLIDTHYRIEINGIPDEPFIFSVEADNPTAAYVKEENKVIFRDHEGDWRLMVIREVDDSNDLYGPITLATCEPVSIAELNDNIIEERRFSEQPATRALEAALQGTRWKPSVESELGNATSSFYYLTSTEAVWKVLDVWGGEFKDVVDFDEETNEIKGCYIKLIQRHGSEHGQRFEIDNNTTEIGRTVLSYPKTALYGRGSSLEVEDEDGEHTGGYTRYIDFADVEWKVSNGDPVDKPKGQKWVGDPEALDAYGYEGGEKHRFGIFSNQDYEDEGLLLYATWEALQQAKKPEVNYRLEVDLFDEKVSLGDTCQAIDRKFARPIEIQARIIAMEYDLMDIEGTMVVEMGQYLDLGDDFNDLNKKIEDIKNNPPKQQITEGSYPDRKPSTPVNLEAYGGMEVIQLYWQYADEMFIKHYEVYGSRTEDFVPDAQHLLWRGDVSAFSHTVGTDEVWYYRVRAVNYHGRPSDWSVQVRTATHRVLTEDIMWGPELAERMRELHRISDIIGENGVDFDQIAEEARDLINQQAREYTDEEIGTVRDELEIIFGEYGDKFTTITQEIDDINGSLSTKVEQGIFDDFTSSYEYDMAQVNLRYDEISSTVRNIRIGGRNLLRYTDFSKADNVDKWIYWGVVSALNRQRFGDYDFAYARVSEATPGSFVRIRTAYDYYLEKDQYYTLSWIGVTSDFSNSNFNYSGVLVDGLFAPRLTDIKRTEIARADVFGYTKTIYKYEVTFQYALDTSVTSAIMIGTTATGSGNTWIAVANVQLERGTMATDWQPAFEDVDQRMSIAESDIRQLADEIDLKVDVDGIVAQINLSQEGLRLKGSLIHLDGLTLIDDGIIQNAHIADGSIERAKLGRAIIGTAQIDDLAVTNAKIASINADKVNAASLSAISANLGTVTAGIIRSSNNNFDFNLNRGTFEMRNNAEFTLGNGAMINFTDSGNWLYYTNRSVYSGLLFGNSLRGDGRPFVAMGVSDNQLNANDSSFNGIRIHSGWVENNADGVMTNIVSNNLWLNEDPQFSGGGWIFENKWNGNRYRSLYGYNTASYAYNLGLAGARFHTVYADNFAGDNILFNYPHSGSRLGYVMENTVKSDRNPAFRPQFGGELYYDLGTSYHRWAYIYSQSSLQTPSDKRLKEDINDNILGLDFIKDIETVTFRLKPIGDNKEKRSKQFGVVAQDFRSVLEKHNVDINDYEILRIGEDGMYGMQYEQLIAPTIKAVQELDWKLEEEINWQRIEYQALKNKVTKLEDKVIEQGERIKQLEESAA